MTNALFVAPRLAIDVGHCGLLYRLAGVFREDGQHLGRGRPVPTAFIDIGEAVVEVASAAAVGAQKALDVSSAFKPGQWQSSR
jgi:hypothetical protein